MLYGTHTFIQSQSLLLENNRIYCLDSIEYDTIKETDN